MKKHVPFISGMIFLLVILFVHFGPYLGNAVFSDTGLIVTRNHALKIFKELTLAGELNHGNNKWALFPTSTNKMACVNQSTAGDYFATVLKLVHEQASHTNIYVALLQKEMLFAGCNSLQDDRHDLDVLCKWIIAENVVPELPDLFPVLMTSNVDPVSVISCMLGNNEKKLLCSSQKSRFAFLTKRQSGLIVCKNGSIILLSSINDGQTICHPPVYGLLRKWPISRHTELEFLIPIGKISFRPLFLKKKIDNRG